MRRLRFEVYERFMQPVTGAPTSKNKAAATAADVASDQSLYRRRLVLGSTRVSSWLLPRRWRRRRCPGRY